MPSAIIRSSRSMIAVVPAFVVTRIASDRSAISAPSLTTRHPPWQPSAACVS
jgi:hypothetical protein